jgi:hypothetical protein
MQHLTDKLRLLCSGTLLLALAAVTLEAGAPVHGKLDVRQGDRSPPDCSARDHADAARGAQRCG